MNSEYVTSHASHVENICTIDACACKNIYFNVIHLVGLERLACKLGEHKTF